MSITNKDLKELMKLVEFTNKFSMIRRITSNKDNTKESDSQHSFQVALVAWYLCDKHNLDLDIVKLFKYSLAHDLVETYAGDVSVFDQESKAGKNEKVIAEEAALEKIEKDFAEFPDLIETIKNYEAKEDLESKFVYTLDKLLPTINIELNNDPLLNEFKMTLSGYRELKEKRNNISQDPLIYSYHKCLTNYLIHKGDYFYPENNNRDFSNKSYDFEKFLDKFIDGG